jgi:hypothetical protein
MTTKPCTLLLDQAAAAQISGARYRLKDKRRAGIMARPANVKEAKDE